MVSKLAFGERRPHPLVLLGGTTLGAFALIAAAGLFLAQSVTEAAGRIEPARTDREVWYIPASSRPLVAQDLDIARAFPVVAKVESVALVSEPAAPLLKVGVESLRVRSGPSRTSSQVFVLKGGTMVVADRSDGGWVEISTEDGRQGWAYKTLLVPR